MSAEQMSSHTLSVATVNAAYQPTQSAARRRSRRGLRPNEVALLTRYREAFSGDVLEIGSRGDGLTEALAFYAASLTGIGRSDSEVDICRSRFGAGTFSSLSLLDLAGFEDDQFDAVFAGGCALDRLTYEQRCDVLGELSRIIRPSGVLIFSAHNLACESEVRKPVSHTMLRPWRILALPRALRNRARLSGVQERRHGYAILNDESDAYSWLNFYVCRDHQEQQLAEHNFALLACVDSADRFVSARSPARGQRELHFVARPER
jgi:SAM-dependent methyltransferase